MSQSEDEQQPVNRFGSPDHESVQPHIAFVRAEEYRNRPTVSIIIQNCFIGEGGIGAQEYPEGLFLAKSPRRIGKQHHSMINFVQGPLVVIHHIGTAFHRYRVKTADVERGSQVGGGDTLYLRVQDTVGFHCADSDGSPSPGRHQERRGWYTSCPRGRRHPAPPEGSVSPVPTIAAWIWWP